MKNRGFSKKIRKGKPNTREVLDIIDKMNLADKLTILREVNRMIFGRKDFRVGE